MLIKATPQIQALLKEAKTYDFLPEDLRSQLRDYSDSEGIPWSFLKDLVRTFNDQADRSASSSPRSPLCLESLCRGGGIFYPAPAPKKPNPENEKRLERLRNELEERRYLDMVSDVTASERRAEAMRGLLPTYRSQISFGAHVLVAMFTLFCAFFYGAKWYLRWDDLWCGLSGALGLSLALVVETLLLIIRSNRPELTLQERMPELFDPKKYNAAFEALRKQREKEKNKRKAAKGKKDNPKADKPNVKDAVQSGVKKDN